MDSDADDPAATQYNDGNRAFLQAFMARGTMTLKEAKLLLAAIFTAEDGTAAPNGYGGLIISGWADRYWQKITGPSRKMLLRRILTRTWRQPAKRYHASTTKCAVLGTRPPKSASGRWSTAHQMH